MSFINSKILTRLCVIINNILLPFFRNFYFPKPFFTPLFNFFCMFFCWIIIKFLKKTLSYFFLCLYFVSLLICCTNLLPLSGNLITTSDSLLNRTSFLQFIKALLSSSERLSLTLFGLVLQNKSFSTEVENVSSSSENVFAANQLDFFSGGLFTPLLFLKLLLLFCSLLAKKTRLFKLFLNLSKSFCNCN